MYDNIQCDEFTPKYKETSLRIKSYIKAKCISPGSKLPGGRKFAQALGVSKNTVYEALSLLESEGIVNISSQSGCYVAKDAWYDIVSESPNWLKYINNGWQCSIGAEFKELCRYIGNESLIYLSSTSLSSEFGFNGVVADALNIVTEKIRDCNILKSYNHKGLLSLREAVASHIVEKGMEFSADEIIITPSVAIAFDILVRGLLNSNNIAYVSENIPAYSLIILNSMGVEIVPVPLDDEGMSVSALKKLSKSPKRPIIILSPTCPNDIGETMSLARRKELLDFCKSMRYPIIEIDTFSDLNPLAPPPLKALDTYNNVIYIGSMPTYLTVGINVGWVIAPPYLNDRFIDILVQGYHYPFGINYFLMEEILSGGSYRKFMRSFIPAMYERMEDVNKMLEEKLSHTAVWNKSARYGLYILTFKDSAIVKKLMDKDSGILFVTNIKLKNIDNAKIYIYTCGISKEQMYHGLTILEQLLLDCSNIV